MDTHLAAFPQPDTAATMRSARVGLRGERTDPAGSPPNDATGPSTAASPAGAPASVPEPVPPSRGRRRWLLASGAVLALAGAGGAYLVSPLNTLYPIDAARLERQGLSMVASVRHQAEQLVAPAARVARTPAAPPAPVGRSVEAMPSVDAQLAEIVGLRATAGATSFAAAAPPLENSRLPPPVPPASASAAYPTPQDMTPARALSIPVPVTSQAVSAPQGPAAPSPPAMGFETGVMPAAPAPPTDAPHSAGPASIAAPVPVPVAAPRPSQAYVATAASQIRSGPTSPTAEASGLTAGLASERDLRSDHEEAGAGPTSASPIASAREPGRTDVAAIVPPIRRPAADAVATATELRPAPMTAPQQVEVLNVVAQLGIIIRDMRAENAALKARVESTADRFDIAVADFDRRLALAEARGALTAAMGGDAQGSAGTSRWNGVGAQGSNVVRRSNAVSMEGSVQDAGLPASDSRRNGPAGVEALPISAPAGPRPRPPAPPPVQLVPAAAAAVPAAGAARYRVTAASPGLAMLALLDRSGGEGSQLQVAIGDQVPGYGRITAIQQRGASWIVQTDKGPDKGVIQ